MHTTLPTSVFDTGTEFNPNVWVLQDIVEQSKHIFYLITNCEEHINGVWLVVFNHEPGLVALGGSSAGVKPVLVTFDRAREIAKAHKRANGLMLADATPTEFHWIR